MLRLALFCSSESRFRFLTNKLNKGDGQFVLILEPIHQDTILLDYY